jgi:phage-related protein
VFPFGQKQPAAAFAVLPDMQRFRIDACEKNAASSLDRFIVRVRTWRTIKWQRPATKRHMMLRRASDAVVCRGYKRNGEVIRESTRRFGFVI